MAFYTLHEKVVQKELLSESDIPATTQGNLPVQVSLAANQELQHLQTLPAGSYKWTWGPTLTNNEV